MKTLKEVGIGSFRPGREPQGRHVRSIDLMGPSANADGVASQRMQYNMGNYDYDDDISYKELGDPEDEDIDIDEPEDENMSMVLECRVYRNGKYCLLETLENLEEFGYADKFGSMMQKITNQSKKRTSDTSNLDSLEDKLKNEDNENEDEDALEEFSGVAAGGGGPAVPLGYTAKGKPETPAQRKKRQRFNVEKSFPYTRLANSQRSKKRSKNKK